MIGFAESFFPWAGATLISAFIGLILIVSTGTFVRARYLAAFATGVFLWFFVDTIGGAASLDVVDAFSANVAQFGTVGLFVVGLVAVFVIDRNRNILSPQMAIGKYGLTIPLLVAVSVGIHGLAEGGAFGAFASGTQSTSIIDAFAGAPGGTLNALIAYALHKGLEPMMVGACYCAYAKDHAKNITGRLRDLILLTVTFGITSLVGAATGYYWGYDVSYVYALGTGTSVYALVRLGGVMFDNTQPTPSRESAKIALLIALGLLALYVAALFHSG